MTGILVKAAFVTGGVVLTNWAVGKFPAAASVTGLPVVGPFLPTFVGAVAGLYAHKALG